MIFCTLFDSNYLDKGLVMYRSLKKLKKDFKLYVLAMDNKCYEILTAEKLNELIPIKQSEFLTDQLLQVKETRTRAEFCWTCTSFLIDYVLTYYQELECTYVDADLYFYSDPSVLLAEMGDDKTVQIVPHRFLKTCQDEYRKKYSGTYCVQFNTFKNTEGALQLLRRWEMQCLTSCSSAPDTRVLGDQGYLENWEKYPNVSVLMHLGGGVAPWNVAQYKLVCKDELLILKEKSTGKVFPLVFYHYHNLKYHSAHEVDIGVFKYNWGTDEKLISSIYPAYLRELDDEKKRLKEKFSIYPLLTEHPAFPKITAKRNYRLSNFIRNIKFESLIKIYILLDSKVRDKLNYKKDIMKI